MTPATLIFLHVPKAGGNSLIDFLRPHFGADAQFDVNKGLNYAQRLQELAELDDETKTSIRFVFGHLPFGVHRDLPGESRYITVLRNPIDRIASHYYFVKEQPKHPLHEEVVSSEMTISDYVRSGLSGELNNGMTRLIVGRESSDSLRGHAPCQPNDLQTAISNLEQHFDVVGLLEKIDPTLTLLSKTYDWPLRSATRRNRTKSRREVSELSESEIEAIAAENPFDLELYRWAETRFVQQCESMQISLETDPSSPSVWQRICRVFS